MKNILTSSIAIVSILLLCSFTATNDDSFVGIYGVSQSDPSAIELKLNADNTFSYQDFSNPENQIKVQGTWSAKNDVIQLNADNSETSFHDKWKITNEGNSAKSRKGMTFYTLRKL